MNRSKFPSRKKARQVSALKRLLENKKSAELNIRTEEQKNKEIEILKQRTSTK